MSGGWNTIESDAGVFTYLIERLGVKDVQFEELISLGADDLEQLGSVYGLIFLFRYAVGEETTTSIPKDGDYDHEATRSLFFAAQTIQNACATQAIISLLLNRDSDVEIGKELQEFKEFAADFSPELRGETLSNSDLIRETHNSFARSSPFVDEIQRVATEADDVFHFIAYTCVNDKLYELDGLQPAPISHGPCTAPEFPQKIIPVLGRRIARHSANEIRFNLMACVKDLRIRARTMGDEDELERLEERRAQWLWENSLRRHNFVGFVGELLKGVVRAKLEQGDGAYDRWVEEAKGRTKKRIQESRSKGGVVEKGN